MAARAILNKDSPKPIKTVRHKTWPHYTVADCQGSYRLPSTAELLLEHGLLLIALDTIKIIITKQFFVKKVPATLAILEFLSTAEGLVIFILRSPHTKGVFVVLHSRDKDEHLNKLCTACTLQTSHCTLLHTE